MVKLKGKLSEFFCCGTKFDINFRERCLFIELRGKSSELFCFCGTFRGIKVNELVFY